ncbi:MAG: hypothetical protein R3338_09195 [Thermoanaerobaculia bacterium]|nr:hypothetical protein [Thermoanaerobaculia bacterium]
MEILLILLGLLVFVTVAAYLIGYSVMGWIVRPLAIYAEEDDEVIDVHVTVEIEDAEEEGREGE